MVSVVLVALVVLVVAPSTPVRANDAWFVEVAEETGLGFEHVNGATGHYYLPEIMGPGVALLDYDGDGDLDVYLLQGGPLDGEEPPPTLRHRLFRNDLDADDGSLRFVDVTADAGAAGLTSYGMGAIAGDYDGDGDPDLFVTAFGSTTLLRNDGDGRFADVTDEAGVDAEGWTASAAFLDYDRDGDLDLFVTHYLDFTLAGNKTCNDPLGARDYCGPQSYRGLPDRLYRNDGGRFSDVTQEAGLTRAYGAGLGVVAADFNGDGWLDLFVANDAAANQLWVNQHDGTFVDEGLLSGTAANAAGLPEGSMGIAAGDADGDGDEDLFITNIVNETHAYYRNGGAADFDDARTAAGVGSVTAPFTGFGTDWFDFDNDGALDLFITNGAVNMLEPQRGEDVPFRQTDLLFRNDGEGRFRDVTGEAGSPFTTLHVGRGAAFGDVDNDGDVDVVVTSNGGPVRLLRNQVDGGRSLQITLRGTVDNRQGLGARVVAVIASADGPSQTIWRRAKTDGSYLSSSDPRVHIGLGQASSVDEVRVHWPSGVVESWSRIDAGFVTLVQGTGTEVNQ